MIRTLLAGAAALTLTAAPAFAQDYSLEPTFGSLNLATGYLPDPAVIPLLAGGDLNAESLGGGCLGYIADAPDFRVNYEAGDSYPLIISVVSDADTTLVINDAAGNWHCNDDYDGLDPAVFIESPPSGQYDIWVGSYDGPTVVPAGLYISEVMTGGDLMGAPDDHAH